MLKIIFLTICFLQFVLCALQTSKFFLSFPRKATWSNALKECEKNNYDLVSIESFEKERKLEEFLRIENADEKFSSYHLHQMWTSGFRSDVDGEFYWKSTGNKLTYTKWRPGEPTGYDYNYKQHEDCLALWHINNTFIEWNDSICSLEYYYVCEKSLNVEIPVEIIINCFY